MPKLSRTEQLFRTLPVDVQYDIDMQLYQEFNNAFCIMERWRGELFSVKDIKCLKIAETRRKRELTERWLKENEID